MTATAWWEWMLAFSPLWGFALWIIAAGLIMESEA